MDGHENNATVVLNQQELERLQKAMRDICGESPYAQVSISYQSGSIGSIVKATFPLDHAGYSGEYTITITDQADW